MRAQFGDQFLFDCFDGGFHVSLTATTVDEEEPQLLSQEIASERVATLDDALAVIKNGVRRNK